MLGKYKLDAAQVMAVPAAYLDPATILIHRADANAPSIKHAVYFDDLGWALAKGYSLHSCIPQIAPAERERLIAACPTAYWERIIR